MPSELDLGTSLRRRWLIAAGTALPIPLLELASRILSGHWKTGAFGYLAIQTPVIIFALTAHHEWVRRRHVASVIRTLVPSVLISVVTGALGTWLLLVAVILPFGIETGGHHPPDAGRALGFGAFYGLVHCAVWTLGYLYPFTVEDVRLRAFEAGAHKLEAARLRLVGEKLAIEAAQLRTTAELMRLRSQLEPHFMLNTLNTIAGLVVHRPRDARRLLGCLGDLLRDALNDSDEMQTLDQEVAWLRRYAEILESRHAGFLTFEWVIDDETLTALLPRLLLQPLVENAVNHGAMCRADGGAVTLRTSIERRPDGASEIVCVVEDNGPGLPETPHREGAFGLRSVRRRLELAFDSGTFHIESTPTGTRSVVRLPQLLERRRAS